MFSFLPKRESSNGRGARRWQTKHRLSILYVSDSLRIPPWLIPLAHGIEWQPLALCYSSQTRDIDLSGQREDTSQSGRKPAFLQITFIQTPSAYAGILAFANLFSRLFPPF
jgi:hypothetical protein